GELIRHRLAQLLLRGDVHDPELNRHSITVGEVRMSPDLKVATAYVMPLGGAEQKAALDALKENARELRPLDAKETGLKYAPALRFQLDETFDRIDDTRRMFSDERVRRDVEAPREAPAAEAFRGDEPGHAVADSRDGADDAGAIPPGPRTAPDA